MSETPTSAASPIAGVRHLLEATKHSPQRVIERFDARFNVPNRYRGITIATSEHTPAIEAVQEALECDDRCLVPAGPTGVGKTHAAIAAAHEQVLRSGEMFDEENLRFRDFVVWHSMSALARTLLSEQRDAVVQACIEADLVVVDDVGGAYIKPGGLVEALFEEIVCTREADGMPMILTTNLTLPAFAQVMGDRIADRLRGGWGFWVSLPGQSRRRKRAGDRR